MNTFTFIKSAVASEIMQLPEISFDCRQDNEQELLDHIESNGYCQPSEIGTTAAKAAAGNHNHAIVEDVASGLAAAADIQALAVALSTRIKALEPAAP